ncbi:MAG: HEAT repeat domain-containing protein [Planctomycetota bacterium]|jgi:HEAT repeat protein|nr:HEAT repeat domain-containing protein [Blastopirellula sp.]
MKSLNKNLSLICCIAFALIGPSTVLWAQQSEQELLAVLRSEAPKGEKAITCKRLAVYGSEAAVSELAKLLADPELSSWSRIALEAIPGSASKAALREAAGKLEGRTLIGVLNSLGVLRDSDAVPLLVARCKASDSDVAAAAIAALGEIGNAAAADALKAGIAAQVESKTRAEYAQAAVVCAERLMRAGNNPAAAELYQLVRQADVPKQRQLEATRGLFALSGTQGGPILAECLNSADEDTFRLGLTLARVASGNEVQTVLSQAIRKAQPDRAGLVLLAMADRLASLATANQPADLSPLTEAAAEGAKPVRLSALNALGRLGNVSVLDSLLKAAGEKDPEIATAAKQALAEIPGEGVNQKIGQLLGTAGGEQLKLLVELAGSRRIPATADLQRILDSRDRDLRRAALLALGETVELKDLSLLVERASAANADAEELAAARQALRTAAVRMPQPDECAELLAGAVARAPEATQVLLIETLGEVGGRKSLDAIIRLAKGDLNVLQDAGSKVLGKWSNLADAEALLDYARTGPSNQYRLRALKGYIALARRFAMPEAERVKMCRQSLELFKQPGDRKLVLDVLRIHPSPEAFLLATELAETGEVNAEAMETAATIAQKLGGQELDLERLKRVFGAKAVELEILEAKYGAGDNWQDVTDVLRKLTGKLPWVSLPSPNYNQSFGGDPAPGVPKQLRVRYRINGKEGEVSLAENALVLLPTPKQ